MGAIRANLWNVFVFFFNPLSKDRVVFLDRPEMHPEDGPLRGTSYRISGRVLLICGLQLAHDNGARVRIRRDTSLLKLRFSPLELRIQVRSRV